ncbi:N-acetylmuramidase domain-containing protein [Nitratireductor soli]|uniref:N-acetylmuramidase domain-containing protein n=1 Tax=Nitratireductor soli TaxID=1670619 RepID=UPI0009E34C8B|nr:N-acetylmuramidase domain-containing protein [Nitratireductor soli]
MSDREITAAARQSAKRLGIEVATMLAVIEIESAGKVYSTVGRGHEPLIRFEGHYFDRRLSGPARERARREGLAHPSAGKVKNPTSQAARWTMLNKAILIDAKAALESTSWGLGQVMGAHWKWLGFGSVDELVNTARGGAAGQVELMVRYIEKAGLKGALQRRDWAAFARGYNGPAFAKHGYHTKLASAYRRYAAGREPAAPSAAGMLRLGSRGARVRELQQLLLRAGQSLLVDGDFGPATHKAVMAVQKGANLEVDGVAGPQTMRALEAYRHGAGDRPGEQRVTEIGDVRDGIATGVGGGVSLEVVRRTIDDALYQVGTVPGLETISTGLAILAALLAIGGLVWAGIGWWRARRTVEAPT